MRSVTSSLTPGIVSNSWSASSKRTWVTAAPGIDESSVRRRLLPERVAEARLERRDHERLRVAVGLAGLDLGALDDQHTGCLLLGSS